ncbi:cytochrome bd oxidase small subunit CydS [Oceanobacillus caeni]
MFEDFLIFIAPFLVVIVAIILSFLVASSDSPELEEKN